MLLEVAVVVSTMAPAALICHTLSRNIEAKSASCTIIIEYLKLKSLNFIGERSLSSRCNFIECVQVSVFLSITSTQLMAKNI